MGMVLSVVEAVTDASQASGAKAMVYLLLSAGYFALWLIPGFKGNRWRERNLSKRGYEFAMSVKVETPDAAIARAAKPA
jgi:hypothetical protein